MDINLRKIPFSRFGSYIAIKQEETSNDLFVTTMHGFWLDEMNLLKITPIDDDCKVKAYPWKIEISSKKGNAVITLNKSNGVLICGKGTGIKIEKVCEGVIKEKEESKVLFSFWEDRLKTALYCTSGELDADLLETKSDEYKLFVAISAIESEKLDVPESFEEFDENIIKNEYEEWTTPLIPNCEKYKESAKLAAYILWNSTVAPCGNITCDTVLMSKNWMHYVWAWDHCFNAIALAKTYPSLSWEQIKVFFDNQQENGMLPDLIYPNNMNLGETKPPVHGWCFEKLLDAGVKLNNNELAEFYFKLKKWTKWWFEFRDYDKDGICQYNLNNESGHDNSTVFDEGKPVEVPDLTAFLILQIKCLKRMANMLNLKDEEQEWEEKQNNLFNKFMAHSWQSNEFVSLKSDTHKKVETKSIINLMPIVLGEMLPADCFKRLVEKLSVENDYLSPYGLVTEAMTSEKYNKHADDWRNHHAPETTYWRGAVWAPVIYLITDGLRRGGELSLAKEIALRFCNMVNGQDGIFENYDSQTGKGDCDPAYTWTCSVFLQLIKDFLE